METNLISERYNRLYNKAIVKKSNIELLLQQKLDEENQYKQYVADLTNIVKKQLDYEQAVDVLKKMIDNLSKGHIQHLSDLLNSAVSSIFFDREYSIELKVEEFKNTNTLKILLHEMTPEGEVVSDISDNGYGLKGIIGFILQVYFILYYKLYPILFLDEAFGNLSSQYLPYLKSLIQSLTAKYEFKFVLITHDERLMEFADRTYQVKLGEVKLINLPSSN